MKESTTKTTDKTALDINKTLEKISSKLERIKFGDDVFSYNHLRRGSAIRYLNKAIQEINLFQVSKK